MSGDEKKEKSTSGYFLRTNLLLHRSHHNMSLLLEERSYRHCRASLCECRFGFVNFYMLFFPSSSWRSNFLKIKKNIYIGDGFADLFNHRFPVFKVNWNPRASVSGLLAFVFFSMLFCYAFITLYTQLGFMVEVKVSRFESTVLPPVLMCAAAESFPLFTIWGNDNLVIFVVAGVCFRA